VSKGVPSKITSSGALARHFFFNCVHAFHRRRRSGCTCRS